MIFNSIQLTEKYRYLDGKIKKSFEFLESLRTHTGFKTVVQVGDGITAHFQEYKTSNSENMKYETHDRHLDIHYIVSGQEFFGIVSRKDVVSIGEYDTQNDLSFYQDPVLNGKFLLKKDDLVVVFPEEAHKPRIAAGKIDVVEKVVIKVSL